MPIINMIEVESSQIHSIGHAPETKTLAIRFYRGWGDNRRAGALYHYQNVSVSEFEALKNAESVGRHFGQQIKPFADKYPYEKVAEEPSGNDQPLAA